MMIGDSSLSMEGFVDIHVHILPGLDDGARTKGDAIAMADIAAKCGIREVVATPHVDPSCLPPGCSQVEAIRRAVDSLQESIDSCGISIQVMPGMEIAMTPGLVAYLTRGAVIPVSDSGKYVLVELPFQTIPSYAEEEIFNMAAHGYIPIIAHPERNAEVIRNPNILIPFLNAGALAHVNAGSLMGRAGQRPQEIAEILLRHGLAHIIASDGHSATSRQPGLDRAFEIASRLVGEDKALRMVRDIPLAITLGEDVHVNEPEVYQACRKWWRFRRKEGS
jgi:protein-tyrosine phosphatase